jgi:hypothetical protein
MPPAHISTTKVKLTMMNGNVAYRGARVNPSCRSGLGTPVGICIEISLRMLSLAAISNIGMLSSGLWGSSRKRK